MAGPTTTRRTLATLAPAFVGTGFFWGALGATTADLKHAFALSPGRLGLLLASFVVGGGPAALFGGALADRLGSRRLAIAAGVFFAIASAAFALSPDATTAAALAALTGASSTLYEIGINTEAVGVERITGARILGRLHASFYLGGGLGAATAAALLAGSLSWRLALALSVAFIVAALVVLLIAGAPPATGDEQPQERVATRAALRSAAVRRMAAICFIAFMLEGALGSWSGIYLRDSLGAAAAAGSLGVGVLFTSAAFGALLSDRVGPRIGSAWTLALGGTGACAAITVAIATHQVVVAAASLVVAGCMLAMLAPTAYSQAGSAFPVSPAAAVSALTAVSYLAFIVGPLLMGWLTDWLGLRTALGLHATLGLVAAAIALGRRRPAAQLSREPAR